MSGADGDRRMGATVEPDGVLFRVPSRHAARIDLCLFGTGAAEQRLPMELDDDGVWSLFVPGLAPGCRYGLRVDGPYAPARGHRFDVAKLLVDPWARAVTGPSAWHPAFGADRFGRDTAERAPRCVVPEPSFDWRGDRPPSTPWERTVIYEAHVKGLTRLHPALPEDQRGTYLGLSHPAVVEHLLDLGVTAVQLLPIQQHFTERHLVENGLTNYWGYSPLAWLAPHADYAAGGDPVWEIKETVRRLHDAGLEVLLDVVLNHTAEGGARGPTLSLRGLDNRAYYRLADDDPSRYLDFTGCGNTVDFGRDPARRLALDALRYWVEEVHVDGFRFDLAVTLGRGPDGAFSAEDSFLTRIRRDPVLERVKLIAEPWDLGPGGYRLGGFPTGWAELNDRFRDQARAFALGRDVDLHDLERRLAGSTDLFPPSVRGPSASVNFVTSHDGFTLEDTVSYARRHNEANRESNRDGHAHELSVNHGVEGPTRDRDILEQRRRAKRRLLTILALARGVPLMSHGDELSRTQLGNNNAYCQDNPISWVAWSADVADGELVRLWRWLMRLRRRLAKRRGQEAL